MAFKLVEPTPELEIKPEESLGHLGKTIVGPPPEPLKIVQIAIKRNETTGELDYAIDHPDMKFVVEFLNGLIKKVKREGY